jgi:hypothetical protein
MGLSVAACVLNIMVADFPANCSIALGLPAGRYWYQYDAWVGPFTGNQSNFAESDQICAYYLSHEMV